MRAGMCVNGGWKRRREGRFVPVMHLGLKNR